MRQLRCCPHFAITILLSSSLAAIPAASCSAQSTDFRGNAADPSSSFRISRIQSAIDVLVAKGPGVSATSERLKKLNVEEPAKLAQFETRSINLLSKKTDEINRTHAQAVADYTQSWQVQSSKLAADLDREQKTCESLNRVGPAIGSLVAALSQKSDEAEQLSNEKDTVLSQLKTGHFCSECMRSKLEIEKSGVEFYAHLKSVGGTPVVSQEKYDEKERHYNTQIRSLRKQATSLADQIAGVKSSFNAKLQSCTVASVDLQIQLEAAIKEKPLKLQSFLANRTTAMNVLTTEIASINQRIAARKSEYQKAVGELNSKIAKNQSDYDAEMGSLREQLKIAQAETQAVMAEQIEVVKSAATADAQSFVKTTTATSIFNNVEGKFVADFFAQHNPVAIIREDIRSKLKMAGSELQSAALDSALSERISYQKITAAIENAFETNLQKKATVAIKEQATNWFERSVVDAQIASDRADSRRVGADYSAFEENLSSIQARVRISTGNLKKSFSVVEDALIDTFDLISSKLYGPNE